MASIGEPRRILEVVPKELEAPLRDLPHEEPTREVEPKEFQPEKEEELTPA